MHKSRLPEWRFDLLDSRGAALGRLDGVEGGSCSVAALSRLGWSGSLSIRDRGQDIDWLSHRVRVSYSPGRAGIDAWPVCTMMLSSPSEKVTESGTLFEVGLLSTLAVVDEDKVAATWSRPAGTPIISTVVDLIRSTGEDRIAVTESTAVMRGPVVYRTGTPKLTIINELLTSAGYWSLWCDGSGTYRVEPYVDLGTRSPAYEFRHGETSVYTPEWSRDQDMSSVPNRYLVVGQGTDDAPGPEGSATNNDPNSKFSVESRGRVIAESEDAEVADVRAANVLAQRRLADRMDPVARLSVTHAVLPLNPHDLVIFAAADRPERRATVQEMSWDFTSGSLVSAEWREVSV